MNSIHYISTEILDLAVINDIVTQDKRLELSDQAKEKIKACRVYLDEKIKNHTKEVNSFFHELSILLRLFAF